MQTIDPGSLNLAWCRALFDGLYRVGIERVVVSPGSRSTPLALAAARDPRLTIHIILDERSAAFFAVGAARGSGRAVALVATSGSAVANWLPAVVEADLSRIPLVLLSADRPLELRGWGANQTIEQPGLFGNRVRSCNDLPVPQASAEALAEIRQRGALAAATACWPLPGPVHLNVPLREPLVPKQDPAPTAWPPMQVYPPRTGGAPAGMDAIARSFRGCGLIVCGPALGANLTPEPITKLATTADCPILADPLSGLRCGPHQRTRVMTRYEAYLRAAGTRKHLRPDWILRLGGLPVSKFLGHYLGDMRGVRQLVVDPHGRWPDPLHTTTDLLQGDPAEICDILASAVEPAATDWVRRWRTLEHVTAGFPQRALPTEACVVQTLIQRLPADSCLFSGNSMPIRDLDAFLTGRDAPLRVIANRGASGIDGNLSTVMGLAAVSKTPVVALIGDLACLHDLGALAAAKGLNAAILVIDNDGGGIFGYLPQAGLPELEPLFLTPQSVDLKNAASAYGVRHRRLDDVGLLGDALTDALRRGGVELLVVPVDRQASTAAHQAYWQHAATLG